MPTPTDGTELKEAYYNRFTIKVPAYIVEACHHSGDCTADIEEHAPKVSELNLEVYLMKDAIRAELKEYGAWNAEELADNEQNWRRMVWIACADIAENENS